MPIYEYQCGECAHTLEALQKMSDPVLSDCPACGKPALSKQVSAPSFRLAGGGWYETDFKTGKKKNLAGDDGKSSCSDSSAPHSNDPKASAPKASAPKESSKKTDAPPAA